MLLALYAINIDCPTVHCNPVPMIKLIEPVFVIVRVSVDVVENLSPLTPDVPDVPALPDEPTADVPLVPLVPDVPAEPPVPDVPDCNKPCK